MRVVPGGSFLYIEKSLKPSRRTDLESLLYVSKILESTFAEISRGSSSIIIGSIYKHPSMNPEDFFSKLGTLLEQVSHENKTLVLLGDFNIDLLKFDSKPEVIKFLDILSSYLLKPYITLPTRITNNTKSLIDNIFISSNHHSTSSGNFLTGISDHLIQFTILNGTPFNNSFNKTNGYYRDWKSFDDKTFCDNFNSTNWNKILQLDKSDPNLSFDNFYQKLNELVNDHVPLKKVTKKQLKRQNKPWVTRGLLKSMTIRDKLLKKFIRAKHYESKNKS